MAGHQGKGGFCFVRVSILGKPRLFTTVTNALYFLDQVLREDMENGSEGSGVDVKVVWLNQNEARQYYRESGEEDWGV